MTRKRPHTILRGGGEITFDGYLPDRTCLPCGRRQPAGEFLKRWRLVAGVRYVEFGLTCQRCEMPPAPFPNPLNGIRIKGPYVDDTGRACGWWQRTRDGEFGEELPLEAMTGRILDGIWRPQPARDRQTKRAVLPQPPPTMRRRA
jgi:hypothetical protein